MTEWWTYRPSSFLLFSARTYERLIVSYNDALWPLQWVLLALCLGALIGRSRLPTMLRDRAACAGLALAWGWVAWGWEHSRFASINWAAEYVAVLYALQAIALLWQGVVRDRIAFSRTGDGRVPWVAWGLVVLGLIYPLLTPVLGRPWSQAQVFGLMPEPTALVTLGLLLRVRPRRRALYIVPVASCLYAGMLLWALRAPEALLPPAAALITLVTATLDARRARRAASRRRRAEPRRDSTRGRR